MSRGIVLGLSFDIMGTVMRVKGGSVASQYQRILTEAAFNAGVNSTQSLADIDSPLAQPEVRRKDAAARLKFIELVDHLSSIDPTRLDECFRRAYKDVSEAWVEPGGLGAATLAAVKSRRRPVRGGASPVESTHFWQHVVHRSYSTALLSAKTKGSSLPMPPVDDSTFLNVFYTLYDAFATADPYEVFAETELCLSALRKVRVGVQREASKMQHSSASLTARMHGPLSVAQMERELLRVESEPGPTFANPGGTEGALNPYARPEKSAPRQLPRGPGVGRLSVVTNFDGRMQRVLSSTNLQFFFDDVITTHDAPPKPSPAGILRAWSRMDPAVAEVLQSTPRPDVPLSAAVRGAAERSGSQWLHIGDGSADAEAAAAAGAEVLLVQNPSVGLTFSELQAKLSAMGLPIARPAFGA